MYVDNEMDFSGVEVTAITRAPIDAAQGTRREPTPPTGAQTSAVSPGRIRRTSNNSIHAVRPFSKVAAAVASLMPSGSRTMLAAAPV